MVGSCAKRPTTHFHTLGDTLQPSSPIAAVIAVAPHPLMAIVTEGKYYLGRTDDGIAESLLAAEGNPSAPTYDCHVCRQPYERPDPAACATHDAACARPVRARTRSATTSYRPRT